MNVACKVNCSDLIGRFPPLPQLSLILTLISRFRSLRLELKRNVPEDRRWVWRRGIRRIERYADAGWRGE